MEKHQKKTFIAHEHLIDFKNFTITKEYTKRPKTIGFIGRLSQEKGIMNFIKALSEVLKEKQEYHYLIGGDGLLHDKILDYIKVNNLEDAVTTTGWITHDKLPEYLNQLRLLVVPSYTEGLPNIILEAMACGTPVLVTPVGAIPDIIQDRKTGFIIKNNTPSVIAKGIIKAIEYPKVESIIENAQKLVQKQFNFSAAVKQYTTIIQDVL